MGHAATVSRGARGFVLAGALFLAATTAAAAVGASRSAVVALGLYGFVLHTVFGKAYSLVPAYFDRALAWPRAPQIHLPLAVLGTLGLAAPGATVLPVDLAVPGSILWAAGAALFLVTVGWTIRDNFTGAETGTAEAKAERARVDRVANGFVPVALASLALGAAETVAVAAGWPSLSGSRLAAAHLLAVGTAALLVFAIGARLLPRLLSAPTPDPLVWIVPPAGAVGTILLVAWFVLDGPGTTGPVLVIAALSLSVAVLGHAVLVVVLLRRAPRPRIGAYGVLAGAIGGVVAVGIGAGVGLGWTPRFAALHPRLGLLGFLGLTIVGVVYHFYPPAIAGDWGDHAAAASILLLGGGLAVETVGVAVGTIGVAGDIGVAVEGGRLLVVAGGVVYAGLLTAIFAHRG